MIKYITEAQKNLLVIHDGKNALLYGDDIYEAVEEGKGVEIKTESTKAIKKLNAVALFLVRLILVPFKMLLMWDIEPLYQRIDPFVLSTSFKYNGNTTISYIPSRFDKSGNLIILPQLLINGETANAAVTSDTENIKKAHLCRVFDICAIYVYAVALSMFVLFSCGLSGAWLAISVFGAMAIIAIPCAVGIKKAVAEKRSVMALLNSRFVRDCVK